MSKTWYEVVYHSPLHLYVSVVFFCLEVILSYLDGAKTSKLHPDNDQLKPQ